MSVDSRRVSVLVVEVFGCISPSCPTSSTCLLVPGIHIYIYIYIYEFQELEDMCCWLDNWEKYIQTLPQPRQKLFLSRQTCQGLRVTLRSVLQLTETLLCEGFSYVLTGKFSQDPLEVNIFLSILL